MHADENVSELQPLIECELDCPSCPEESLRPGKTFRVQITPWPDVCHLELVNQESRYVQCNQKVQIEYSACEQGVQVTLCEGTVSEQTLFCCLPLEYIRLQGYLELIFNVRGYCNTNCTEEPEELVLHAIQQIPVDEICYYCVGTRPTITNGDLCTYFVITIDDVSEDGWITFTVRFANCPQPLA